MYNDYDIQTRERISSPQDAIKIACRWAESYGYQLESRFIHQSPVGDFITTGSTLKSLDGRIVSKASGKGIGDQAVASGLFEAVEHAATAHRIPGIYSKIIHTKLQG